MLDPLAPPAVAPVAGGALAQSRGFARGLVAACWRTVRGRRLFGWKELLRQIDETGPRSLPIVLLSCALIGLMLAYMGGAQLGRIGAQGYVADLVTVGMVRELAGMVTAIVLAGRVGATFAAELGAMTANEEIDALEVFGIDPMAHLVLPRMLGLLLVFPFLMTFGALAGIVAGWPPAVWSYGATSAEYLEHSLRALTFTHVWIGAFKGALYAVLLALAGCREGLRAGRTAHAVGVATTRAVVLGLVWIVAAACLTTVFFTLLGY